MQKFEKVACGLGDEMLPTPLSGFFMEDGAAAANEGYWFSVGDCVGGWLVFPAFN